MDDRLKKFIGDCSLTVLDAMQMIQKNARNILYILDDSGRLLGSLSDGDIRRFIIKNGKLEETIEDVYYRKTRFVFEPDVDRASIIMKDNKLYSIPVLNIDRKVVDIIFDESIGGDKSKKSEGLKNTPVIIMAGGKGTRLYPYTKILPKPLVPIGEVPVIERIMNEFHKFGADSFIITVNYKKEMIKAYFAEQNLPYHIDFQDEYMPLGTAGGIRLIKREFKVPIIITNCDILIETDYDKVIKHHLESGNEMTIVSSLRTTVIPYGVIRSKEQGLVESIEEKPQISSFINTGMYVLNPEYIDWIPENELFHMTDLTNKMISEGKRVGMYPIGEESFLDMGEFEEMKKMEERIGKINT